jgi:hypothetical protein
MEQRGQAVRRAGIDAERGQLDGQVARAWVDHDVFEVAQLHTQVQDVFGYCAIERAAGDIVSSHGRCGMVTPSSGRWPGRTWPAARAESVGYDVRGMTSEPAGAYVPATVRNAFLDLIEDETPGEDACRLASQLMTCMDVLPYEYCDVLELPEGSTFAEAAHKLRGVLGCES